VKRRSVLILATALAVLAVVGAGLFLVRAAEDRVTQDLVARTDRFAIPPTWTRQDDIVRPERFLCMSTNPCPSIARRWDAGKELTLADLEAVTSRVGFEMKTDGVCRRQSKDIGRATVCESTGTDGKYDYTLSVTSPGVNEPSSVGLNVRPRLDV
jgi:hypothetical protein